MATRRARSSRWPRARGPPCEPSRRLRQRFIAQCPCGPAPAARAGCGVASVTAAEPPTTDADQPTPRASSDSANEQHVAATHRSAAAATTNSPWPTRIVAADSEAVGRPSRRPADSAHMAGDVQAHDHADEATATHGGRSCAAGAMDISVTMTKCATATVAWPAMTGALPSGRRTPAVRGLLVVPVAGSAALSVPVPVAARWRARWPPRTPSPPRPSRSPRIRQAGDFPGDPAGASRIQGRGQQLRDDRDQEGAGQLRQPQRPGRASRRRPTAAGR